MEQTRLATVNLRDEIERCQHSWPVEISLCPYCQRLENLLSEKVDETEEERVWGCSVRFLSDSGEAGGS